MAPKREKTKVDIPDIHDLDAKGKKKVREPVEEEVPPTQQEVKVEKIFRDLK